MVQFGIVETGDQVGCARAAGRKTDAQLAGELGVGDRHERGHFFVPNLNEFDVHRALQATDNPIDAVARIAIKAANAPSVESFDDKITDFHLKPPNQRATMPLSQSN